MFVENKKLPLIGDSYPLLSFAAKIIAEIFIVEQVCPRALYPRIFKDCNVGCNTCLYTHTCYCNEFLSLTVGKVMCKATGGFEKMCSQQWVFSSAGDVFLMVTNLELNIKTLKGL